LNSIQDKSSFSNGTSITNNFFGYEASNNILAKTSLSTELLLSLLAVKIIATSVAAGSGLVDGLFAPSLFKAFFFLMCDKNSIYCIKKIHA
jgi:Voltage gated chloride channel